MFEEKVVSNKLVLQNVNEMIELLLEFTEIYKKYYYDINLREAECYKILWRLMVLNIEDGDLFAGRIQFPVIGFSPQPPEVLVGYYIRETELLPLYNDPDLTSANRMQLNKLIRFWRTENTVYKAKQEFPEEMRKTIGSDNYMNESGIAFSLWRMSGTQLDYDKLLQIGIPGLRKEIINYKKAISESDESYSLYTAMLIALDTLVDICNHFADMVQSKSEIIHDDSIKNELLEIENVLRSITISKPKTLREAIQLMYIYSIASGSLNYGRIDEYLADFYVADLEKGLLDDEEIIRLLSSLWVIMDDRGHRYDTRMTIGGKGRRNIENANRLALIIMETSRRVKRITPQLTLRFDKDQDSNLYQKGLDVIADGTTYPILYNDDVNIPAVQEAFEISYEEAIHYIPFGCGEYTLYHRSVGTPSGVINLLQALSVTLHKGIDPISGKQMGLPPKEFGNFDTFDELFFAYKKQVEYYLRNLAQHEVLEYKICGQEAPFLYFSMLYDNCIEKGKGIFSGGVKYLGGTMESYGNTNTSDSLYAIKKLVYDENVFSLDQYVKMLDADYVGFEKERRRILELPKYGNDYDEVDEMFLEVHDHVCTYTRDQREKTNLDSYLVVIINNDTHIYMGENTAASPDGRKAGEYMANGNSPMDGADKSGVTAFLNSIVKPDTSIHAGAVQNMKFSKELFIKHRDKIEILLEVYFEQGGAQAMITVVSRGELEDAIEHPEKYPNLIVRVGGFSIKFVDLPPHTQREILERTLHGN